MDAKTCILTRRSHRQYQPKPVSHDLIEEVISLAAHDLGLGTVIMGVFDRKGLEEYLQLPEGQELMALIALGWPADEPAAPKRKDVETLLSYR